MSDGASFETERGRDDQPERDDLLDPEDIDAAAEAEPAAGEEPMLPDPDDLPESQGSDILDAERQTEDAGARPQLSDEEG